jgi:2-polyprenyl-3-methyl-5-hydroxy-6-metoxy-1,4-benzoquinol methylase
MVPPEARVLELGAGPGSITRRLRAERGCHVTAIELESSFLPHLQAHCERVIQANLNDSAWLAELAGEKFDSVVAADVLEHLNDPAELLRTCAALLAPTGSLVISLPHIGHAVIHACLMDEDFEYRDAGLLDRTHIRFFGLKNMQTLVESAGFKVVDASFVGRAPEDTEYAERWRRAPDDLKAAVLRNPHATVYQCVLRVVPVAMPGEALELVTIAGHAPRVTMPMRFNRLLKQLLPAGLYRLCRRAYGAVSKT